MIISASRRTDIPAFFGKDFYENLLKGEFIIENPFNKKKKIINFNLDEISGIVFWTKNPENFFKYIEKIKQMNIPFYFQFTINNYPLYIEPEMKPLEQRIEILLQLYEIIYPYPVIWRYDPIILTKDFNENFHIENFSKILEKIHYNVHHITVSFLTIYKKIKKIFPQIMFNENSAEKLLKELEKEAEKYNKNIDICCMEIGNFKKAKCINAKLLRSDLKTEKHYGQRKLCNCDKSIDIGFYRTCRHNCVYCYAK